MSTNLMAQRERPGLGLDRTAERNLRDEVRAAVSRLLGEQQLLVPGPADEERIAALIRERVAAYQRRAAMTNAPLLIDPEAVEQRLFDGLLRLGILQPLMDDGTVEEIICNGPNRILRDLGAAKSSSPRICFSTTMRSCAAW